MVVLLFVVAIFLSCIDAAEEDNRTVQDLYLHTVEMAVTGSLFDELGYSLYPNPHKAIQPFDAARRENGDDWPIAGHTMVGHKRLRNIRHCLETVIHEGVPGAFLELGVWRGGACIYAQAVLRVHNQLHRNVSLFDAFGLLPFKAKVQRYLNVSVDMVKHNFEKYKLLRDNVAFYRGLFKDTVPVFREANPTLPIAVLRIDGNFYDSYQDALYYLYDLVPVGGFVIFDDVMSHRPVMDMWNDFKKDQRLIETLSPIDMHSAFFRKVKKVKVDMAHFKPPRDANLRKLNEAR